MQYVYLLMYAEPWGHMARSKDCRVCLLIYKGVLPMEELASKLLPLAKGDMIAFSDESLTDLAFAWSGMATWCRLTCFSFSCCVLV